MGKAQTAQIYMEQRANARMPVDESAVGFMPGNTVPLDCQVVDISAGGACVHIKETNIIPEIFKLFIPKTGWLYTCKIVRQNGRKIGVKFLAREPLNPAV